MLTSSSARRLFAVFAAITLLAPSAHAQVTTTSVNNGDNAWMLTSSALVLLMTGPGLALFYCGLVRRKNVLNTMMQCFAMMAVVTVLWAFFGWSLAFSPGCSVIGGFHQIFLHGVGLSPDLFYAPTIPAQTFMVYQLMFAIITPALISGAFAERMKFSAMLAFTTLWIIFVYSPMAHMVWGKGGLLNFAAIGSGHLGGYLPSLDFAGGTVVHISSGVSALVTCLYLGKRLGYPQSDTRPHSVVLSLIGACMLWVGWFGFNAGSALSAGTLATSAFVATHFAAAAAAIGWCAMEWNKKHKVSALGAISGAVAGLVAITPASGFVTPMAALAIGFIAGAFCYFMVISVKTRFGYDDSLDAFGVHGAGGTIGALLTGVFANSAVNVTYRGGHATGLLEGYPRQLLYQAAGVLLAWAISIIGTLAILFVVDKFIGLRVTPLEEEEGLDLTQHGEEGYEWETITR
ncbi:MAG: ammonium transporter [Acidobacteriaceae bacterium]|nr:ammonium transporter [Acidobacteriaceae bacterium]